MSVVINELKVQRAAGLEAAKDIQATADAEGPEGRDLTAEEKGKVADLLAEHKRISDEIARREALEAAENELKTSEASEGRQTTPAQPETTAIRPSRIIVPHTRSAFFENSRDAYSAGQFYLATIYKRPDAREWCLRNGMEFRIQSEGVAAAGGVLVPDVVEDTIYKLRDKYGTFRANARSRTMGSDHEIRPRLTTEATAAFVGEGATITAADLAWDTIGLTAKKAAALTRYSSEVGEDAIVSMADEITDSMAQQFARLEDEAGWNGEGNVADAGIRGVRFLLSSTNTATYISSVNAAAGLDQYSEYTMGDLANAMSVVHSGAVGPNCKWYCSHTGWIGTMLRLLAASGGATLAETQGGASGLKFLGYPVVICRSFPIAATDISAVTFDDGATLDDVAFVFGDLSKAATFGDRRGITVMVSTERYMELDQIAVRATERFDIVVHDLGTATAGGPIAALCAE